MTREMNKPDWEQKYRWVKTECYYGTLYEQVEDKPKQRVLNPLIAEFFERCCNMERLK